MANEPSVVVARAAGFNPRPLLLLVGIAAAVAAGVAVMLWWQGPNWSLLYGNLEANDANQVVQALQTAGIKYKLSDDTGAVMVPAEDVHAARLKLAAQGLPEGSSSGLDLINKDSGIGVSQFMENARYQYALETELARTISSLRSVAAARIHLAITQQSAFVRDRHPVSASVFLQLRPGGRLESEQVQAIIHLVASSIPDLSADQVTVVDQQGRLLSSPASAQSAIQTEQFAAAQRIEDSYVQRIEQLLVPLVGAGKVRAQVTVDLDTNENEQSHEEYKPDSAVVRSEQTSEQTGPAAAGAGGVPGALTNQPPAGGTVAAAAPAAAPATGAAGAQNGNAKPAAAAAPEPALSANATENVSKQATRNFEINRTLSYTRQPGGSIKRVTVAVLLDNVAKVGADGKSTAQALSAAQLDNITKLVKNAVGFDEARGDSVSVVNEPFHQDNTELAPETVPLWQRPMVQDIARLALGALLLLAIALGVLRPLIRNLTAQAVAPALAAAGTNEAGPAVAATTPTLAYEQQVVQAKNLVTQDPKRVAQVVKTWVGE
ncbi:MAG TPA: flagellar basal-body MS-ring/collar protein FliF [Steroidobacteraceae bacterium]|nr:flagellar basal-body MS-ring/collar protein FliF [Steroidobacteraceae bacterium]